jgi:hypothetical protein
MHPGEMNIDPIEAEFFSTEALDSHADALVRGAIQNSLDARLHGERLRVRILFPSADGWLAGAARERYLAGLKGHLEASRSGVTAEALPKDDEPLSYLVIEDFGTRGLQGNPVQAEDLELEPVGVERNDFFYFWRNVGRSRKSAEDLGRWGLGKTVFQAASRINSFYALTVRANDGRRLLLGQSVLKVHRMAGERYYPYGYFGSFLDDFATPIDDAATLDAFARDFGLEREQASGLSVVLPYPDGTLTAGAIVDAVVRHYFMPILGGDLAVEIVHDGKTERLDADSLPRRFARGGEHAALARMFELARFAMSLPAREHVRLAELSETAAPKWNDAHLDTAAAAALRARFEAERPIAVTVPVWVKPAGSPAVAASFAVYLQRDEALERSDEHFVRDGITVTGVRAGLPKGLRALVLIRDKALSALLGDSENPAHTEWQERSPKFKDRYRHGATTLRYVRNVARELVRVLTRPAEGRDYTLLRQLFSLELPTEAELPTPAADVSAAGSGEHAGEGGRVETVGTNRRFVLQKLAGGFRIRGLARGERDAASPQQAAPEEEALPATIVSVAYEVRRGNPFAQYHRLDFDLAQAPIEITTQHAHAAVLASDGNTLVLRPERPDFVLTVRGFDRHRDLRVRAVPAAKGVA